MVVKLINIYSSRLLQQLQLDVINSQLMRIIYNKISHKPSVVKNINYSI